MTIEKNSIIFVSLIKNIMYVSEYMRTITAISFKMILHVGVENKRLITYLQCIKISSDSYSFTK